MIGVISAGKAVSPALALLVAIEDLHRPSLIAPGSKVSRTNAVLTVSYQMLVHSSFPSDRLVVTARVQEVKHSLYGTMQLIKLPHLRVPLHL
jgi:hypothetical protein